MYFRTFPNLLYTLDDGASYQATKDIFRRTVLTYATKLRESYFLYYDVKDKETPEIVAHKFYRNTNLHWIILHANEILDPRYDWVLSQQNLIEYIKTKYGENSIYDIHHWEYVVNEGTEAEMRLVSPIETELYNTSISNWEYEDRINEAKRKIKVVVPELVPALQIEFQKLIKL